MDFAFTLSLLAAVRPEWLTGELLSLVVAVLLALLCIGLVAATTPRNHR